MDKHNDMKYIDSQQKCSKMYTYDFFKNIPKNSKYLIIFYKCHMIRMGQPNHFPILPKYGVADATLLMTSL